MDHLIDELFLFSKLELNSIPFHFEQLNLFTYFQDLIEELQFDLEGYDIRVTLTADGQADPTMVTVDREQLKRIAMNIIQNSVKYMNKIEKKILVHLQTSPNEVVVKVQDNGDGIVEEALPYIFEQFYRTDLSRSSGEGNSGLGLAIVKRIVEQHGGRVWAESEVGMGTSIFFTFPRTMEKKVNQ